VVCSLAILLVLAHRLPPGILRDLAAFIADCLTTVRRLRLLTWCQGCGISISRYPLAHTPVGSVNDRCQPIRFNRRGHRGNDRDDRR
jgi:hypothetical protein